MFANMDLSIAFPIFVMIMIIILFVYVIVTHKDEFTKKDN